MKVKVSRCQDVVVKTRIREVTKFILPKLFKSNDRLLNNVCVTVKIDNDLTKKEKALGLCYWTDDRYRPRRFMVVMSENQSKREFITTLIHELVHVKQYAVGDLRDYCSGAAKWKKRVYEIHPDDPNCLNSPWEKEAYRVSQELYNKYCAKTKK